MMVQCPGCRVLFDLRAFTAEGGVLEFSCTSCAQRQKVQPEAPAVEKAPPPAPVAEAAAAPPVPLPEGVRAPATVPVQGREAHLWAAWNKVALDWANPRAHEVFVAYCVSVSALTFAGVRYREHLAANPDDTAARKGRDRVLAQAVAVATNARDTEDVSRWEARSQWVRLFMFVGSAAVAGLFIWQMMRLSALGEP